jgi:tetratricopeptide (TPR) repeat protein
MFEAVTPRMRVLAGVALAAAAAAALVVGAVAFTRSEPQQPTLQPRPGLPPLVLDLGVREDAEARGLRRALRLYDTRRAREAGDAFRRLGSVQARVGEAFAAWPDDSLATLERLAQAHPRSAVVLVNLGIARFWAGHENAVGAWRQAVAGDPDSEAAVRASDLLHPDSPRGLPVFVPSFAPPSRLARLAPERQLAALTRAARSDGVRARLLYGVALQRLGRPLSAEREYAAAAALAPQSAEAQVAAAVGAYTKDHPERAFGRLGPLTRRFPRAPTVRFHLGLLLLWLGRVEEAKKQLRIARALGPKTPLGMEANRFLERLENIRTN